MKLRFFRSSMKKEAKNGCSEAEKITVSPSEAMQVNIVKPLEDSDFSYIKQICDNHDGWELAYEKKVTKVWTKPVINNSTNGSQTENVDLSASKFRMIKVYFN